MSDQSEGKQEQAIVCPHCNNDCQQALEIKALREEVNQLQQLVRTDELTGLYNFRFFSHALEMEMERTRRSDQPTSLIMLDLDHFKQINDEYGHEAGNAVLYHVAKTVARTLRRLDIPCRYGGEEIMIILPDTSLEHSVMLANRLRLIIENSPITDNDVEIHITASFGVAVYQKGDDGGDKEFIANVDALLYKAKEHGRNRVCHGSVESLEQGVSVDEKDALLGDP